MSGKHEQGVEANTSVNGEQPGIAPNTQGTRGKRVLIGRMLLAGLLIGAALILQWQWPWVKGLYYQAAGTEAPPSTIPWRDSFDSAMAEVKASDKPLLVVFSASWCPACIAMKHDVWPDSDVSEAVTNGFVPLFVDVDEPRHAPVVARYGGQSVPVFVVVDRDGEILRHESWLMSRSKILTFLDSKVR